MLKRTFITIWLICLTLAGSSAAFAHEAIILKTFPAVGEVLDESPPQVIIWFAEELVSADSDLTVVNRAGVRVDEGDGGVDLNDPDHASMIVSLPLLPDGSYTVVWQTALLDGDIASGTFDFVVGEVETVPLAASAAQPGRAPAVGLSAALVVGVISLVLTSGLFFRRRRSHQPGDQ